MAKAGYQMPDFKAVQLDLDSSFMIGSVTTVKIQISEVRVKDFEDGFESNGGFKDISFD